MFDGMFKSLMWGCIVCVVVAGVLGYGCHSCVVPQLKRIRVEITK